MLKSQNHYMKVNTMFNFCNSKVLALAIHKHKELKWYFNMKHSSSKKKENIKHSSS